MKQRRLLRFHGLRRPRVRQTWNKYNLFNLTRMRTPLLSPKTFFQQKWMSKALTRGYHGEHIKEHQWERMFSRRPLSVVNMDPSYMARHDGSEQAAGRGSGLQLPKTSQIRVPRNEANKNVRTPYMQMVFAPMERRLDIAIFRALFASSARQARQFVIHGAVTVNGKKMTHPSYLLNPGDMFQVDIDRVMMATGKPKGKYDGKALKSSKSEPAEDEAEAEAEAETEEASTEAPDAAQEALDADAAAQKHRTTLKELKERAQTLVAYKDKNVRAKQKQSLRKFLVQVKETLNATRKPGVRDVAEMSSVEKELSSLFAQLTMEPAERVALDRDLKRSAKKPKSTETKEQRLQRQSTSANLQQDPSSESTPTATLTISQQVIKKRQRDILRQLMEEERTNPHDLSKPYATPWKPREWMSPFAFIPRYLEVNQRICAAVYLRHPVARPGRSEVPTPFSPMVSQLAFNWYLRRG